MQNRYRKNSNGKGSYFEEIEIMDVDHSTARSENA